MKTFAKYLFVFILGMLIVRFITDLQQPDIDIDSKFTNMMWPNIDATLFTENVENNLKNSIALHQGTSTNFCGFAVVTYHLLKDNPNEYLRLINDLYNTGTAKTLGGKVLKTSKSIRKYAGTIKNKGILDVNHADQLWFMVLAENYKGYVNIFNWSYDYGDESTTWASVNFAKLNRIWSSLVGQDVNAKGSDLIRPSIDSYYNYIKDLQKSHSIILYLNNTVLNKRDFSSITIPIPTHFVELYDLYPQDDYYVLEYWDYGFKTKEMIRKDKFNSIIYGISFLNNKTETAL